MIERSTRQTTGGLAAAAAARAHILPVPGTFWPSFFMVPKNWCNRSSSSSSSRRAEVFFFSTALLTHQRASAICLFVCSFSLLLFGHCQTDERERNRRRRWQSWCWRDAEKMQRGEKEKESHYDMSDRGEKRTWRWWPLTRCTNSLALNSIQNSLFCSALMKDFPSHSFFCKLFCHLQEKGRGGERTTNLHLHVC